MVSETTSTVCGEVVNEPIRICFPYVWNAPYNFSVYIKRLLMFCDISSGVSIYYFKIQRKSTIIW